MLAALTLLTLDLQVPTGPTGWLHRTGTAVLTPLAAAADRTGDSVAARWSAVVAAGPSEDRLRSLAADNARLRAELRAEQDGRTRAGQVESMLRAAGDRHVVPAQVVAVGPAQGFRRTVTLDVGRLDGVPRDSTVVAPEGLVGRVVGVAERTATVLLLVDPSSAVGGRVVGSRRIVVLRGTGGTALQADLLAAGGALRPGERVVTLGSQDAAPYVAGVAVGEVSGVDRGAGVGAQRGTLRPAVDPARLDVVGVVLVSPRTAPRAAVAGRP